VPGKESVKKQTEFCKYPYNSELHLKEMQNLKIEQTHVFVKAVLE